MLPAKHPRSGLSGDSPDHSDPRLQEDVTAFVDRIGEPVYLVGWSSVSGALGAAAHSDSVAAVALYESGVISVAGEDVLAGFVAAVEQVGEAAADGRLADAARAFAPSVQTDSEIAALDADFFEQWGRSIPALIRLIQQAASYVGTRSTDPGTLRKITVPVLLLVGHETRQAVWFTEAAHHIAKHVADPEVRELPSIGHFAPVLAPEIIAQELIRFFESVRQPA